MSLNVIFKTKLIVKLKKVECFRYTDGLNGLPLQLLVQLGQHINMLSPKYLGDPTPQSKTQMAISFQILLGCCNLSQNSFLVRGVQVPVSDRQCGSLITNEQLANAPASFKKATGVQRDGIHPRHFSMLSPEGIHCFCKLLMIIELLAT